MNRALLAGAFLTIAVLTPAGLARSSIGGGAVFDCDAGPLHSSALSLTRVTAPFVISGTIRSLGSPARNGFYPSGKVMVGDGTAANSQNESGAGFELKLMPQNAPKYANQFVLAYVTEAQGVLNSEVIGPPTHPDVPFSIAYNGTTVTVTVDGHQKLLSYVTKTPYAPVSCFTGEFLFTNLLVR